MACTIPLLRFRACTDSTAYAFVLPHESTHPFAASVFWQEGSSLHRRIRGNANHDPTAHHCRTARTTARRWRARAAGRSIDPMPVVRLFTPDAHATWLLAALDPTDGDTAYGLIDLGIGMPALGTVKLSDLAAIVGPQAARDARQLLSTCAATIGIRAAGAENGSIMD